MSGREDLTDTVPPPEGEDDAYSAATKIGAMPAELLERLRAEGLLPAESDSKSNSSSTHEAAPETPRVIVHDDSRNNGEGARAEEARGEGGERSSGVSKVAPEEPPAAGTSGGLAPAPVEVETPVVRQAPPFVPTRKDKSQDMRSLENHANKQLMVFVVVGMLLLVAFAFAMALLSHRG